MVVTYEEVKKVFDYEKCEPKVKVALAIFYYPEKSLDEISQRVPEIARQDISSIVHELVQNGMLNEVPKQYEANSEPTYRLAKLHMENLEEQLFLTLDQKGR